MGRIFLTTVVLLCLAAVIFVVLPRYLSRKCMWLSCISLNGIQNYSTKDIYEESNYTYRALLTNRDNQLRVTIKKVKAKEEAENYIESETTRLKGIFEKAPAPYPGEISDSITCPAHFAPDFRTKTQNDIVLTYFSSFLTSRLSYGVCDESEEAFRVHTFLFFCPSKLLTYQLELISPKLTPEDDRTKLEAEANSIRCQQ